jgi:2-methylisocitrate lyase-like PEP mutase family enzyme
MLAELKSAGTQEGWLERMQTRKELYQLLDYDPEKEKHRTSNIEHRTSK